MIKTYSKQIIFGLLAILPAISIAAVPAWQIVPEASSLSFTATQNGAPVTGQFKKFTGEINFDPANLSENNVKIIVDLASITDAYNQLSDTLKTPDWFNTNIFPQAIFQSSHFVKTGNKTYQSTGTLTIRDKTLPVTLTFTQQEYTPAKAVIKGNTTIKRTAFGVGQGEWADTNTIKDDVQVSFTVTAVKK
jgi:polyisoprenoid-binding protein YceI